MKSNRDHLLQSDVAKELGVTTRHSFVAGPFKQITAAVADGATAGTIVVAGKSVAWKIDGQWPVVPRSSLAAFRAQATLKPRASADYLNRDQLATNLEVTRSHPVLNNLWNAIRAQMGEGREDGTVAVGGEDIEWKSFYSERNLKFPYIHTRGLHALRRAVEHEPKRATGEELPISRVCTLLSIKPTHPIIRSLIRDMDAAITRGERSGTAKIGNGEIPWNLIKSVWGGSSKYGGLTPHIPSFAIPTIAEAAGVKIPVTAGVPAKQQSDGNGKTKATPDKRREATTFFAENSGDADIENKPFLTRWDVSKALGVTPLHTVVSSIFSKLDAAIKNGETQGTIDIAGQDVPWQLHKRPNGGSPAPTLPGAALQNLYTLMPPIRKTDADYLSREQAAKELGIPTGNPILQKTWTMMRLQAEEGHDFGTIAVEGENVTWRLLHSRTNGQFPYIERSSLQALQKALTVQSDATPDSQLRR